MTPEQTVFYETFRDLTVFTLFFGMALGWLAAFLVGEITSLLRQRDSENEE